MGTAIHTHTYIHRESIVCVCECICSLLNIIVCVCYIMDTNNNNNNIHATAQNSDQLRKLSKHKWAFLCIFYVKILAIWLNNTNTHT